ncbi:MAG: tyrosine-type recombinase/integrase [Planctomycetaceae bacterium]
MKAALDNLPEAYPCYVMLMLNCGFRHVDVSELQWSDLRLSEERLVIQRNKLNQQDTAPVVSYPLWDTTIELIERHKSDHEKFVFTNHAGNQVEDSIKTWWGRNRDKYGLGEKRLDYVRKTGSTFVERRERLLDEIYLGESLSTTAKIHYSFNDGEPCKELDKAIAHLGAEFGFCEPPTKTIELTPELMEKLAAAGIELPVN